MAGMIVIAVYVVVGAGAAASVTPRRSLRPLLMLLLWPFLLPSALFAESDAPRGRRLKIEALREELRLALSDAREHKIVDAFVERALSEERALIDLDAAIATSSPTVHDRLEELRARTNQRIETALSMLEEMIAQLTLLRFSELASKSGDEERRRIEDLLSRIETLAALNTD